MLLTIILSDFQQYRSLLAKVIQFFVSTEKVENQLCVFDSRPMMCSPHTCTFNMYIYCQRTNSFTIVYNSQFNNAGAGPRSAVGNVSGYRWVSGCRSRGPIHSRRVVVSYKRKYVHELLVNRLFKPAQEKVWLGELTVPQ